MRHFYVDYKFMHIFIFKCKLQQRYSFSFICLYIYFYSICFTFQNDFKSRKAIPLNLFLPRFKTTKKTENELHALAVYIKEITKS